MKKTIIKKLNEIAKEKNIEIIFAVESGSRVWRLESNNSDYDVRFVFVYPLERYISIDKPSDVIDAHYDKEGNQIGSEGCFIDMCGFDIYDKEGNQIGSEGCFIDVRGFDIFKFSKMLSSSNPTVIEWLKSDILYLGKKPKAWIDFAENQFKRISLYFHYKSMCRQNYLKYLKSGNLVSYKKYLYAMRGLVNAKFITWDEGLPPINFNETLTTIKRMQLSGWYKEIIPFYLITKLEGIIQLKKEMKEKEIIKNIPNIDNFIESFLKSDDESPKNKQLSTNNVLDDTLKNIVLK